MRKAENQINWIVLFYHVDRLHRTLMAINACINSVLEAVGMSLTLLEELNGVQGMENEHGYTTQVLQENCGGHPSLNVKQEQLEYLLRLGFNCPKIAEALGVSLSTISRRMSDFGLSVSALYSSITD